MPQLGPVHLDLLASVGDAFEASDRAMGLWSMLDSNAHALARHAAASGGPSTDIEAHLRELRLEVETLRDALGCISEHLTGTERDASPMRHALAIERLLTLFELAGTDADADKARAVFGHRAVDAFEGRATE